MSWAEVKKAVNSNIDVPLNELIEDKAYCFGALRNDLKCATLTQAITGGNYANLLHISGKCKIHGVIVDRKFGIIRIAHDGTTWDYVLTSNVNSPKGGVIALTSAWVISPQSGNKINIQSPIAAATKITASVRYMDDVSLSGADIFRNHNNVPTSKTIENPILLCEPIMCQSGVDIKIGYNASSTSSITISAIAVYEMLD